MLKVVNVEKIRELEASANKTGMSYESMMENAGRAIADRALSVLSGLENPRVTVLVGSGNNGGDGLVAGRLIAQESEAQVRFYLLKKRDESDVNFKAVQDLGLFIAYVEDDRDHRVLRNMVSSADLVMDALLGIGLKLPLKGDIAKVLRNVKQALGDTVITEPISTTIDPARAGQYHASAKPYVLAVDCPSGLNCDTGEMDSNTAHANETITFIAAKPGLFLFPGAEAVGKLSIAPIGLPVALDDEKASLVDSETARNLLPKRSANSNKGTFGKALVVAGSVNYVGAPALAAEAAYRVGTGLVTVAAPQSVVSIVASRLPEPTWLVLPHDLGVISSQAAKVILEEAAKYSALLLGPGFGRENTTREMLLKVLDPNNQKIKASRQRRIGFSALKEDAEDKGAEDKTLPPLVIDADGLNLLSEIDEWWKLLPAETIITPHPGEMGRLAGMKTEEVQANRWELVKTKAAEWNVILLLKGAHTLIGAPDGRIAVLPFKTDALAKAGTGDVLSGIIVGLLAQGLAPFDAAVLGGYLHGLAGQSLADWGSSRSVVASDLIDVIGATLEMIETI